MFYGGSPISWHSSQQAFVMRSTAGSELVAYCESLLVGRATEALLCAIWGVPLRSNSSSGVIYGDNMAAIGLANGTACASWRTRHLCIRAAILREAIDDAGTAPGGSWRLPHLKGSELVADGLTKHLLGQSFFKFVEDLGLTRPSSEISASALRKNLSAGSGGAGGAAMRAMVLGGMLLSAAEGRSEEEEFDDFKLVWIAGIVLMTMGAIYTGQLLHSVSNFSLRRLRVVERVTSVALDWGEEVRTLLMATASLWCLKMKVKLGRYEDLQDGVEEKGEGPAAHKVWCREVGIKTCSLRAL